MKKFIPILALALMALSALACKTVTRAFSSPETPAAVIRPTSLPPTLAPTAAPATFPAPTVDSCPNGDCITACVEQLKSVVKTNAQPGEPHAGGMKKKFADTGEEYDLVTYPIQGQTLGNPILNSDIPERFLPLAKDRAAQQQIWDYFAAIIPQPQRTLLNEYIVFTDGTNNLLAAVAQSDTDPAKWVLYVDIQDSANPKDLTYTLIHEFGHLLTLNPAQVPPSLPIFKHPDDEQIYESAVNQCPTYFPGEGCSTQSSYINQFVDKYWNGLFDEWNQVDALSYDDREAYYTALDDFYNRHQDQFVTDYAPTSPEEDIAETFSYFILLPKPAGSTIADQKVLWFYTYPELVQLRAEMGRNLCAQLEK